MEYITNTRSLRRVIAQGQKNFQLIVGCGHVLNLTITVLPGGRFKVFNHIDGSTQRLTGRQLYTQSNIGRGMRLGALL